MELLKSLGINSTVGIHLICFLVSYITLSRLIFRPYGAALKARESRTVGNEEFATKLAEESVELQSRYEDKARELNNQVKTQFDSARKSAMRDYDQLIEKSRTEATTMLTGVRQQISKEISAAEEQLSREVPLVSKEIVSKLLGKEVSA